DAGPGLGEPQADEVRGRAAPDRLGHIRVALEPEPRGEPLERRLPAFDHEPADQHHARPHGRELARGDLQRPRGEHVRPAGQVPGGLPEDRVQVLARLHGVHLLAHGRARGEERGRHQQQRPRGHEQPQPPAPSGGDVYEHAPQSAPSFYETPITIGALRSQLATMSRPPSMNEPHASRAADEAAAAFEALRPRLVGVAYGLLGTLAEAEDAVQEAWIRLQRSDLDAIEDLAGWLVTTTSRIALDILRSARVRRESYVGPWLPEPVETAPDPADSVALADSMSWAMLVGLETLSP